MAFLGFGKRRKPNLTPDVGFKMPSEVNSGLYTPLSDLAKRRIQAGYTGEDAPGVGFGPDFLNRATSPAIASREARFRETEMPQLSSELSKRGVSRSVGPGLASDVITRAGQSKERDINELIARFQVLNEAQKKTDITQGIGVGQDILGQDISQANRQAEASERLVGRTAERATQFNADDKERQQRVISALAGAITGGTSGGFSGAASGATAGLAKGSPQANTLSNMDDKILELLEKLYGGG